MKEIMDWEKQRKQYGVIGIIKHWTLKHWDLYIQVMYYVFLETI